MKDSKTQSKLVIVGGFLLLASMMGVINNCFGIFIIPITREFGWTRAQYTVSQSLISVSGIVFSAFCNKIYARMDVAKGVRLATLTSVVCFLALSRASSLPVFYIAYFTLGLCQAMTTIMPMAILVGEWIPENTSSALGLVMMGSGVGGMVFNPLANVLILNFGWRTTFAALAVILGIISNFASFVLVKRNPEAVRLQAHKDEPTEAAQSEKHNDSFRFFTTRIMGLALCGTAISIGGNTLNATLTTYVQDIGYSQTFAANCQSIGMGVLAAGKVIYGMALDRIGLKNCLRMSLAAEIIGLLGFILMKSPIYLVMVFTGILIGCPFGSVGVSALAEEAGGKEHKGDVMGKLNAMSQFGVMMTPVLSSSIYDNCSSYVPYYWLVMAFVAISLLLSGSFFKKPAAEK